MCQIEAKKNIPKVECQQSRCKPWPIQVALKKYLLLVFIMPAVCEKKSRKSFQSGEFVPAYKCRNGCVFCALGVLDEAPGQRVGQPLTQRAHLVTGCSDLGIDAPAHTAQSAHLCSFLNFHRPASYMWVRFHCLRQACITHTRACHPTT